MMNPDRFFSPDPTTVRLSAHGEARSLARELYEPVANLPIISPHGHVDPRLFADPKATFGSPADLLIIPDHYVTRMLYSQGIPLEELGIMNYELGKSAIPNSQPLIPNHRKIWQLFCSNFHLFRGTPSGIWLTHELHEVFGIAEKPSAANADRLYDLIAEKLASPEFSPRALFERFNIEVLCTTDAATDTLEHHQTIKASGWTGQIRPTFRPDAVVNFDAPNWRQNIEKLEQVTNQPITNYQSFIRALEQRREFFKSMGATAADHAALTPAAAELSPVEAEALFQRALKGQASVDDAARFTAHMLMEMARMSSEDGLVMQLHPGSFRNHNQAIFQKFGNGGCLSPISVQRS